MDIAYVWPPVLPAGQDVILNVCVAAGNHEGLTLTVWEEQHQLLTARVNTSERGHQVLRVSLNPKEAGTWLLLEARLPEAPSAAFGTRRVSRVPVPCLPQEAAQEVSSYFDLLTRRSAVPESDRNDHTRAHDVYNSHIGPLVKDLSTILQGSAYHSLKAACDRTVPVLHAQRMVHCLLAIRGWLALHDDIQTDHLAPMPPDMEVLSHQVGQQVTDSNEPSTSAAADGPSGASAGVPAIANSSGSTFAGTGASTATQLPALSPDQVLGRFTGLGSSQSIVVDAAQPSSSHTSKRIEELRRAPAAAGHEYDFDECGSVSIGSDYSSNSGSLVLTSYIPEHQYHMSAQYMTQHTMQVPLRHDTLAIQDLLTAWSDGTQSERLNDRPSGTQASGPTLVERRSSNSKASHGTPTTSTASMVTAQEADPPARTRHARESMDQASWSSGAFSAWTGASTSTQDMVAEVPLNTTNLLKALPFGFSNAALEKKYLVHWNTQNQQGDISTLIVTLAMAVFLPVMAEGDGYLPTLVYLLLMVVPVLACTVVLFSKPTMSKQYREYATVASRVANCVMFGTVAWTRSGPSVYVSRVVGSFPLRCIILIFKSASRPILFRHATLVTLMESMVFSPALFSSTALHSSILEGLATWYMSLVTTAIMDVNMRRSFLLAFKMSSKSSSGSQGSSATPQEAGRNRLAMASRPSSSSAARNSDVSNSRAPGSSPQKSSTSRLGQIGQGSSSVGAPSTSGKDTVSRSSLAGSNSSKPTSVRTSVASAGTPPSDAWQPGLHMVRQGLPLEPLTEQCLAAVWSGFNNPALEEAYLQRRSHRLWLCDAIAVVVYTLLMAGLQGSGEQPHGLMWVACACVARHCLAMSLPTTSRELREGLMAVPVNLWVALVAWLLGVGSRSWLGTLQGDLQLRPLLLELLVFGVLVPVTGQLRFQSFLAVSVVQYVQNLLHTMWLAHSGQRQSAGLLTMHHTTLLVSSLSVTFLQDLWSRYTFVV